VTHTSGLVRYHHDLTGLLAPITDVLPHPDNPNNGDVDAVAVSIEVNGMYRPIYAQKSTRHIVAGNTTYAACLALDAQEIPIIWLDIDNETATKILLADNKTAALAVRDPALETALLLTLDNLAGTGYTDDDLDTLRRLTDTPIDEDDFNDPWPTICVQIPHHVRNAYLELTAGAGGDRQRFERLLRAAGWDG
jgi:ParB-like nuclease domain